MIQGFPQWFFCPTAIYRVGAKAKRHEDPWRYAVLVEFSWRQMLRRLLHFPATAKIWALSADGEFDWPHARPILRWVRQLGYKPIWDRFPDKDHDDALEP